MFDISPCGPGEVTDFTQFFIVLSTIQLSLFKNAEVGYIAQLHYWEERNLLTV